MPSRFRAARPINPCEPGPGWWPCGGSSPAVPVPRASWLAPLQQTPRARSLRGQAGRDLRGSQIGSIRVPSAWSTLHRREAEAGREGSDPQRFVASLALADSGSLSRRWRGLGSQEVPGEGWCREEGSRCESGRHGGWCLSTTGKDRLPKLQARSGTGCGRWLTGRGGGKRPAAPAARTRPLHG